MARRRRRRKERLTGRQILALFGCAGIVALAAYLLMVNYLFVVRSVGVILPQDCRFTPQQAAQQAGIELGTRLDRIDQEKIAQNLAGTGWLHLEEVCVQYPNRVELVVGQRKPAGLVSHVSTLVVTDADGVVIEQTAADPGYADCLYITDVEVRRAQPGQILQAENSAKGEALVALLQGLEKVPCHDLISWATIENPRSIRMYSTNHVWVELGNADNMENKLHWTEAALTDLIAREETLGTLNVSSGTHADYAPQK